MNDAVGPRNAGSSPTNGRRTRSLVIAATGLCFVIGLFCVCGDAFVFMLNGGRTVAVSRFSPGFFTMVERQLIFLPLPEGATEPYYFRHNVQFEIAPAHHAAALAFYDRHFADKGCKRRVLSDQEMRWSDEKDLVDVVAYFCGNTFTDNEYEIRIDKPDPRFPPDAPSVATYHYMVSYNGDYTYYADTDHPGETP